MIESAYSILTAVALGAETAGTTEAMVGPATTASWSVIGIFGAVLAAGVIIIGAAHGISRIASASVEATARQPEAGGRIFTSMVLSCAFIEGGMLFGLLVCFMAIWFLK